MHIHHKQDHLDHWVPGPHIFSKLKTIPPRCFFVVVIHYQGDRCLLPFPSCIAKLLNVPGQFGGSFCNSDHERGVIFYPFRTTTKDLFSDMGDGKITINYSYGIQNYEFIFVRRFSVIFNRFLLILFSQLENLGKATVNKSCSLASSARIFHNTGSSDNLFVIFVCQQD